MTEHFIKAYKWNNSIFISNVFIFNEEFDLALLLCLTAKNELVKKAAMQYISMSLNEYFYVVSRLVAE